MATVLNFIDRQTDGRTTLA